ncbi:MAG: DEAD/DEAH box helicase [Candidatus Methanomethylicaceae archaeon]
MKIRISNIVCQIVEATPEEIAQVGRCLSYVDKRKSWQNYQFSGTYQPIYRSLLTRNSFPTGLLFLIQREFPYATYEDLRILEEPRWLPIPSELDYRGGHQRRAVMVMQRERRGTIDGVTSMGKSFLMAGFAATYPGYSLILCHRKEIFETIYNRCCSLIPPDKVGVIRSGRIDPRRVTVAMVGTLAPRIQQKTTRDFLRRVGAVLVDEAHHIGIGTQYTKVLTACSNATFRFGLTGTPFRESDTIAIFAYTGPIIFSYKFQDALEDGVVVPIKVFICTLDAPIYDMPLNQVFRYIYDYGIVRNKRRNAAIARIAERLYNKGENALILVWRKEHGRLLEKMIKNLGVDCAFIHGTSVHRSIEKERFERGEREILIASDIFSEGVDVQNIQNLIIADGYKSRRLVMQKVGRALRPHPNKSYARIFDFWDNAHHILTRHSAARLRAYKKFTQDIHQLRIDPSLLSGAD